MTREEIDKTIKGLEELISLTVTKDSGFVGRTLKKAYLDFIELTSWTSTKLSLPPPREYVEVWDGADQRIAARYEQPYGSPDAWYEKGHSLEIHPTHWRHLTPPPKGTP